MNGPEILHLIRHDLQHAVARRGKPPTPRPMDVSPWVAMSAMQKAIRRGRQDLALSVAATLVRDAPDKLWRRVGCIAYEDIGVASRRPWGSRPWPWPANDIAPRSAANGRLPAALSPKCAERRSAGRLMTS